MVMDFVEPAIKRRRSLELLIGPDGLDSTAIHQDDSVGDLDRCQTVRNQESGARSGKFLDRLANQHFILDIDGAGCLVEDQDGRVAQHGAGQGDSLALTARKTIARVRRSACHNPWEVR